MYIVSKKRETKKTEDWYVAILEKITIYDVILSTSMDPRVGFNLMLEKVVLIWLKIVNWAANSSVLLGGILLYLTLND